MMNISRQPLLIQLFSLLFFAFSYIHSFALTPRLSAIDTRRNSLVKREIFITPLLALKKENEEELSNLENNIHFSEIISDSLSNEIEESKLKKKMSNKNMRKKNPLMTVALSLFLFAMVVLSPLQEALAAQSGGRMGGSFGRSSSSRSYSSPSSSRVYSRSYSRPSVSYYSSGPRFITPFSPFYNPYYGYGSPGVITVSRGPSFFDVLIFSGVIYFAANAFLNKSSSTSWGDTLAPSTSTLGDGFSVARISVALNVPKRDSPSSILSKLDSLAHTARTDTRVGLQNLLSEVSLELLRQRDFVVGASSSYQHFRDFSKAQREYNTIAVSERSKFDRETVSKYQGVDYSSSSSRNKLLQPSSSSSNINNNPEATVAVVTIVLCIEGDSTKIPTKINSISELQKALTRISSDAKTDSCLQSAEILWTPQDRSESLSLREVFADYPKLRTL